MNRWMMLRVLVAISTGLVVGVLAWMMPPIPRKTFTLAKHDAPFVIHTISSDGRFLIGDAGDLEVWDLERDLSQPWIKHVPPGDSQHVAVTPFSPDEKTFLCASLSDAIYYRTFDLQTGLVKSEGKLLNDGQGFPFFAWDGRLVNRRQHSMTNEDLLFDLESGEEIGKLPESDSSFEWSHYFADFALHRKKQLWRVYSRHTGELMAEAELPSEEWNVITASADGRVLLGILGMRPNANPIGKVHYKLIDTNTGLCRSDDELADAGATPDGQTIVFYDRNARLPWYSRVWNKSESEGRARFVRWADDHELATLGNVYGACFSPKGNLFVAARNDGSYAAYDFPFQKPWGLIVMAGLAAPFFSWGVFWISARWRNAVRIRPAAGFQGAEKCPGPCGA